MNIYLVQQMEMHPSMQIQDVIKFCYQAACGAEHLVSDIGAARRRFDEEFAETEAADICMVENISDEYCRVNLAAWKYGGKSGEELFNLFVKTAGEKNSGEETAKEQRMRELLAEAAQTLETLSVSFTAEEWKKGCEQYLAGGIVAVHHSEIYRQKEKPAYRLVKREYLAEHSA